MSLHAADKIIIREGRVYVRATTPGISGFQQWGKLELRLCDARHARNHRLEVMWEYRPKLGALACADTFRLEDGHIPECQPTATEHEAISWVLAGNGCAFWKVVDK